MTPTRKTEVAQCVRVARAYMRASRNLKSAECEALALSARAHARDWIAHARQAAGRV